jgi:ABC-2 type transport system permease protein
MITRLRRTITVSAAFAAMVPKLFLAYRLWVWMEFFVQILAMIIYVYFWRAVYAQGGTIGGLSLGQTVNYILLAQILLPVVATRLLLEFGFMIREGRISIELLRPLDIQWRYYIDGLTNMGINLVIKAPLLLIAWFAFEMQLPSDPAIWGAFLLTLALGYTVVFFFDWSFTCLAFYTTEVWGLGVVRDGVAMFFSGALLPLVMMPNWLQRIAQALPFAQALYVPASVLSGITPLADVPRLWLVQLIWIVGLGLLSRLVFNRAIRKVTVQGG